MRVVRGETLAQLRFPPGARLADRTFERCSFVNNGLYTEAGKRSSAERLVFRDCLVKQKGLSKLACREITIVGGAMAKRSPMIMLVNCLFDRVTFEGDFNSLFIAWFDDRLDEDELAEVTRWYEQVPLALDLSRARFKQLTVRGVPGDRVRCAPKTSVLVRRAVVEKKRKRWEDAEDLGIWADEIGDFLARRPAFDATVLTSGALGKNHPKWMEELAKLKKLGLAE